MGATASKPNRQNQGAKKQRNQHYCYVDPVFETDKLNLLNLDTDDDEEVFMSQPKSAIASLPHEVQELDDLENAEFPYENIVFEGGGSQGQAYVGVVKELDRLGHLKKLRRYAGASIGAVTACILSMGYCADGVIEVMQNAPKMDEFLDAGCGCCSLIPNTFRHFGWHPGKVHYNWMGEVIKAKLSDPDATFKDLYDKTGKELCIVVTNLSLKMEEYCHVKTTPNLPIRVAVKMSVSLPGLFYPFQRVTGERTDLYVDGGLICNYPVHCFDGWWLSLKPEDSFLRRMHPLTDVGKLMMQKERFGTSNEKTMGLIIFSDYDQHVLSAIPDLIAHPTYIPDTVFGKAYKKVMKKRKYDMKRHTIVTEAMSKFLKVLNDHNIDGNSTINQSEFVQATTKTGEFSQEDSKVLFGSHISTPEEIFSALDVNKDGEIDFHELMAMAESRGVGIQSQIIGTGWTDINQPQNVIDCVFRTLLMNVKRAFLESDDNDRTVMINTAYIKSSDYGSAPEDIDFMIEQGRQSLRLFLRYQQKKHDGKRILVQESYTESS